MVKFIKAVSLTLIMSGLAFFTASVVLMINYYVIASLIALLSGLVTLTTGINLLREKRE